MEDYSGSRFDAITGAVRKKRSQPFRRPPPDISHTYDESNVQSSSSPTPPSDDASKGSSDDTAGGDTNSRRKEFNLNQCAVIVSTSGDGSFNEHITSGFSNKRSSEGVLAPTNWKNTSTSEADNYCLQNDVLDSDNKVTKLKLKVGGVTRTISNSNYASESGSSKSSRGADPSRRGGQGNSEFASSMDKRIGLQGIPWKDFSTGGFSFSRDDSSSGKSLGKSGSIRKSKRAPKQRLIDAEFDDEDDDEIRFVQKLKAPKINLSLDFEDEPSKKQRKLASVVADVERLGAIKNVKEQPKKERGSEDTDYDEEDETGSDGEVAVDGNKKKKQKKESADYLMESKKEMTLTTRQRALQTNSVEFPSGLPPAPPRKQKEKLTDIEQQLKKAEAAQRRRLQNEKAARESEAEAIRKILGQDSNRKKREEKIKKRQEALKEEKAATASMLSGSTIRLVMGPTGTIITFPNEMGLPKMFEPRPCSYPPPRENCAGPCCSNPYKYRDAKTRLPLCSLQCYKAVQQKKMMPETSLYAELLSS